MVSARHSPFDPGGMLISPCRVFPRRRLTRMIDDEPQRDTAFLYELARDAETTELVGYLKRGRTAQVRRRAAEVLGDLADSPTYETEDEVVEALIQTVQEDEDDSVRARAADSLYRHGEESFARLVERMSDVEVDMADDPDWVVSRTLVDWLEGDYPEFRMVAAAALGRVGDETALSALMEALTDPDPRVRVQAVRSCGLIGDTRCVPALADRLDDPTQRVKREATNALGSIGTTEALKALVPVARAEEESIRRMAIDELGKLGSLEPVVVLLRALKDDSKSIQRAAMLSLIRLFVEAPPEQTEEVRETVAEQLDALDTDAVTPQLVDILAESQRLAVRRNAAWLLGRVANADTHVQEELYDCLIDTLDDDDEMTADLAGMALTQVPSDELERRLHILVEDEDTPDDVVERAEAVLEEIGSDLSQELVTNAVDYTYVRDPADYTAQHADEDDSSE